MLQDIQFCSCSRLLEEELTMEQCMIFSFTPRALKILTPQYIKKIMAELNEQEIEEEDQSEMTIDTTSDESLENSSDHEDDISENNPDFTVYKIGENKWRIPIYELDRFLTSLFHFLPGYFEPMEKQLLIENGYNPICCLDPANKSPQTLSDKKSD